MNKSLGLKVCAGLLAVPILATFSHSAFAVNSVLKVGSEDIYTATGTEKSVDETAIYDAATKTLTLKGYQGKAIDTDIASLTIKVTEASTITDATATTLKSSGNVTVTGQKLTLSNGIAVDGSFTNDSVNIDLGATDLTAKGTIRINGALKAGSVTLNSDSPTKAKIMISEKADIAVTKGIVANYTTGATQKGIELNKVCADAEIINITEAGKAATMSTVFSTDGKTGVTKGVKISSALCNETKKSENKENPDTADNIALYVVALVASSAILIYRRHLAKR